MNARETAVVIEVASELPGDAEFARRSDAYLGRALSLACYILGDENEAEDATQDAMSLAWKARRSLRQSESFEAWVDRILINACRDRIRRRRRRVQEIAIADGDEPEARDSFGALMARDAVGRALQALTVDQRTVIVLRYWRDLTLEQIAERLGWPLGTVKSLLHYGLATLREQLERNDREVRR
jgi:RNA polymerase sigma-70 factor (ECF subfamily)